jgi:hypothetical protein
VSLTWGLINQKAEEPQTNKEAEEEKLEKALQVDERCKVAVTGLARRRGVINWEH